MKLSRLAIREEIRYNENESTRKVCPWRMHRNDRRRSSVNVIRAVLSWLFESNHDEERIKVIYLCNSMDTKLLTQRP